MNTFWPFPLLEVRDTTPGPERKRPARGVDVHRANVRRTYDHEAMLRDRMAGLTWREVAQKHQVPGRTPHTAGVRAAHKVMHSNAAKRLTPAQAALLEPVSRRRPAR